jgi:hypothetical protein
MKSDLRRVLQLAATALLLAGCENAPLEPTLAADDPVFAVAAGERVVEEYIYDLTGSAFSFACNDQGEPIDPELGELVYLEGKVMERVVYREDADGNYSFKLKVMPIGLSGVGETSGERFRVIERGRSVAHETELAGWGNYKFVQKLVGRDTGRTFKLVWAGNYYFKKDGSLERERYRERVVCKA